MKRNKKISALLFASLLLAVTGCGVSSSTASVSAPASLPAVSMESPSGVSNTITVNSSEQVTITPDIAEVKYAVRTEKKDAAGCQKQNTDEVNKVIELLKNLGIAETSIQTSDYYMYPIYNYSNNTQKITGYEATTTLTVSDLPIADLGDILTQSIDAGVNNVQSITYQSSKYDAGYQEALKLAVASAKAKAEVLAAASGCSLGSTMSIRENSNYSQARYTDNALTSQVSKSAAGVEMASADSSLNIMPGEMDVEVNITVEYSLQ